MNWTKALRYTECCAEASILVGGWFACIHDFRTAMALIYAGAITWVVSRVVTFFGP